MFERGGHIKFLSRGGAQNIHPAPSPEKCLLAKHRGTGGGNIKFLLRITPKKNPHPRSSPRNVSWGTLNGHRYRSTGKWQKKTNKKHPDRFHISSPVFAFFCTLSDKFISRSHTFWAVPDLLWPSVVAFFRTIRLLPYSGCHMGSLISAQHQNTFLLARRSRPSEGAWVQIHFVENMLLCADAFCQGGCTSNLKMCLVMTARVIRHQDRPGMFQRKHHKIWKWHHFLKKLLSRKFCKSAEG